MQDHDEAIQTETLDTVLSAATTRIDLQELGVRWSAVMGAGGFVVSDPVDITIELELIRAAA